MMNPQRTADILNGIDELLSAADSTHDANVAIGNLIIAISNLKDIVAQSLESSARNESIHDAVSATAHDRERNRAAGGCANAAHASHNANEPEGLDTGRGA